MRLTLDRILQSQGIGTRRDCRTLIRAGRVTVKDVPHTDPFLSFDLSQLKDLYFSVNGQSWQYQAHVTLLMHKPAGYECSRHPTAHASVFELLPQPLITRGVQPIGRLDQDTTGLLLLTDDGVLNHRLSSPKHHVPKVYHVTTSEPVTDTLIERLLNGVVLNDAPESLCALAVSRLENTVLSLSIAEGKYHQVKRMVAAAGNHVLALQRVQIGGLHLLADLAPGTWRYLNEEELSQLR